jgi:hypothetical protein
LRLIPASAPNQTFRASHGIGTSICAFVHAAQAFPKPNANAASGSPVRLILAKCQGLADSLQLMIDALQSKSDITRRLR